MLLCLFESQKRKTRRARPERHEMIGKLQRVVQPGVLCDTSGWLLSQLAGLGGFLSQRILEYVRWQRWWIEQGGELGCGGDGLVVRGGCLWMQVWWSKHVGA